MITICDKSSRSLSVNHDLDTSALCFLYVNSLSFTSLLFQTAVPIIFYGLQHYLSLAGSLIIIPVIIVPAMGGTDVRYSLGTLK